MSTSAAVAYRYSSRALGQINTHLTERSAPTVLDLGPARAANIAYFSSFSGKIFVEDLRNELESDARFQHSAPESSLDAAENERNEEQLIPKVSELIPSLTAGVQFDLIACWDLLPYLPALLQTELLSELQASLAPGGMMLILNADRKDLTAPKIFDIEDTAINIHQSESPLFGRSNTPVDPTQELSCCSLVSSVRLRNGFFELLFRRN